jgi:hypothetical protein
VGNYQNLTLKSYRLVLDSDNKPTAVELSIEDWEDLLDWIEELDAAGALRWEDVRNEWDSK